ncbi:MAG: Ig-like domain-containing protein, partial [Sediminibacterium sp.]
MIKIPSLISHCIRSIIAIYIVQSLIGCANIVPPSGGPRDSIPPYLLVAKPKDSSVNSQPKEIWLAFNEYITTTSLQENVIVSPSLKNNPLISSKLNVLRIKISDTLLPNTTYSIQFGNAIKDVNEGNIAENYTYAFSTGEKLDTASLEGTVQIAETGRFDSTLLVVLHPAGIDTAIYKNKPLYYTRLNKNGKFKFRFLPTSAFNIFVLQNDYSKKYDDSTKLFAFTDSAINITSKNEVIKLYAFQAYKKTEKKKSVPTTTGKKDTKQLAAALKYNKSLEGLDQDLLIPLSLTFET